MQQDTKFFMQCTQKPWTIYIILFNVNISTRYLIGEFIIIWSLYLPHSHCRWMILTQIINQPQSSGNGLLLHGKPQPQQALLQKALQNNVASSGMLSLVGLAPPLCSIPMLGI